MFINVMTVGMEHPDIDADIHADILRITSVTIYVYKLNDNCIV